MKERDELISQLFREEYDNLFKKAYRLTGDTSRAHDLIQETFLVVLLKSDELEEHPNLRGWLSTVLFNISMNDRRLWENSHNVSLEQMGDIFPAETPELFIEILPESLNDDEKRLLTLRFEHRLSYREIGEVYGISEGAARTRLSRLVKKTQKYFLPSEKKRRDL